jgi:serine/threonine protein phosphatase PrpC
MEINEDCKFIILASDGIWEFMDNKKVANICFQFYEKNDPQGALNSLTREARQVWEKVFFYLFYIFLYIFI